MGVSFRSMDATHDHHHNHDVKYGIDNDTYDFEDILPIISGQAHIVSCPAVLENGQELTLYNGIFISEGSHHPIALSGVDVSSSTYRTCCIGSDARVIFFKLKTLINKAELRLLAASTNGDELRLEGKRILFNCIKKYVGDLSIIHIQQCMPQLESLALSVPRERLISWIGECKISFDFEATGDRIIDYST